MRRPVYVVDSFTGKPLSGNAAGVVLDGAELDAKRMQAIAAELKHSETAFPLPSHEPRAAFHLRWFSPATEIAFCGHATLAALHVLVDEAKRIRVHAGKTTQLAFTCKSGLLRVELTRDPELKALIETPPARFERVSLTVETLAALGLVPEALDPKIPVHKSEGAEANLYIAVRDADALARCRPPELPDAQGYVVYTLTPHAGVNAAVRCFFPAWGIAEDPVTGSACGELATLLQQAMPETMPRKLTFTQNTGRVEVEVRPEPEPGKVRAWIGGAAKVILRGELELP